MLLLGVGAAFKEFTIQSEEMKLNLHRPFKGMIHKKKSESERDHCRKGARDLGGTANGMAGWGVVFQRRIQTPSGLKGLN